MPHDHDHHHDHGHPHDHDHGLGLFEHAHRAPDDEPDAPMDAASQSLAEALRQSFRILKGVMVLLVILYAGSGIKFLEPNEEAVVFRFGRLLPAAYTSGALFAWPFPVDEVVRLPVKEANEMLLDSHMLWMTEDEKSKGLTFVSRGHEGLDPNRDGALLTGDGGLVHIRWIVTYRISDLVAYVRELSGRKMEPAERLIRVLVENAAVAVASGMRTEDVYLERLEDVCGEVRRRVNAELDALGCGLSVTGVKAPLSIVPVQLRGAFEGAQQAENRKEKAVQDARKMRAEILSRAAGGAYEDVLAELDKLDAARAENREDEIVRIETRLDAIFENDASGEAGQMLKAAGSHYTTVVGRIESDLALYKALLPEFKRNPRLLFERLWDEYRNQVLNHREVTKIYRPFGIAQIRIKLGLDPEQKKQDEILQNQEKVDVIRRPDHYVPVGAEFD